MEVTQALRCDLIPEHTFLHQLQTLEEHHVFFYDALHKNYILIKKIIFDLKILCGKEYLI